MGCGSSSTAERPKTEEEKKQDAAATKIQAVQRGRSDRKKVVELKEQRAQEEEDRKERERLDAAATKIQAVQRGKVGRELAVKRQEEKEAEAIRLEQERQTAALKIQSVQRGRADRDKVKQMKADKLEKEQEAAATKIQAVQRGRRDRARVIELRLEVGPEAENPTIGTIHVKYNHYEKDYEIRDGILMQQDFFSLHYGYPNSTLLLADLVQKKVSQKVEGAVFALMGKRSGEPCFKDLANDQTYFVHVIEDEHEAKLLEEQRKKQCEKRLVQQKKEMEDEERKRDVGYNFGGEDNASCSCLEGNPCVDKYNCKDWENRMEVAKKNGYKYA